MHHLGWLLLFYVVAFTYFHRILESFHFFLGSNSCVIGMSSLWFIFIGSGIYLTFYFFFGSDSHVIGMSSLWLIFIGSGIFVTFYFFLGSDSHVIGMCSICATGGQYQAPVITNSMHCGQEKQEKNPERLFLKNNI